VTAPTTLEDVLADLVTDGVITEDQSAQIATALRERMGAFEGHHGGFDRGARLETVAKEIGIDSTTLRDALKGGQTIAEVADANGSSAEAVIGALVAEMNTNLDQAVTDGKLTTEQADEIRADALDRITAMVNGEFEGHKGFGRHHGMGPGFGTDLDDPTTNSTDTST
jgi:polyhydroxyalkanoate synthesis regulator phasin